MSSYYEQGEDNAPSTPDSRSRFKSAVIAAQLATSRGIGDVKLDPKNKHNAAALYNNCANTQHYQNQGHYEGWNPADGPPPVQHNAQAQLNNPQYYPPPALPPPPFHQQHSYHGTQQGDPTVYNPSFSPGGQSYTTTHQDFNVPGGYPQGYSPPSQHDYSPQHGTMQVGPSQPAYQPCGYAAGGGPTASSQWPSHAAASSTPGQQEYIPPRSDPVRRESHADTREPLTWKRSTRSCDCCKGSLDSNGRCNNVQNCANAFWSNPP